MPSRRAVSSLGMHCQKNEVRNTSYLMSTCKRREVVAGGNPVGWVTGVPKWRPPAGRVVLAFKGCWGLFGAMTVSRVYWSVGPRFNLAGTPRRLSLPDPDGIQRCVKWEG